MKPNSLIVSEVFYSVQGEGQTVGIPAVFLRLAGCNLLCEGAGWRCDTIEVWKKGKSIPFHEIIPVTYLDHLQNGAHLVITGGEPLLHQDAIVDYLNWFRRTYKFTPIVEVETNGTIEPNENMLLKIDYWNVSPKLANSGEPYERRVNEIALRKIKREGRRKIFKFVIATEMDMLEIGEDYGFIDREDIMLMPAGDSCDSLVETGPLVVELSKTFNYRFSPRLHIYLWNKKTGV